MCEYTCQCAFVNGCMSVHKCVITCAHTSDYALQRLQNCLAGVQCRKGSLSFPGLWLCWSCLGPGRPLPKVEKVCWRFRGLEQRPFATCRESPLLVGLWLGAVRPQRYWPWEGRGHVLSTCSCRCFSYCFDLEYFAASALPPLPHLPTGPLLLSMHFVCSLFFRQWSLYTITDLNKTTFPFLCVMNSAPVSAIWSEKCSCFQCCQILCLSKLIKNIL